MTPTIQALAEKAVELDPLIERLTDALGWADRYQVVFAQVATPDLRQALERLEAVDTLLKEKRALEEENKRAWRERNEAVTRVKAWEAVVCLVEPFPPLTAVQIKEWGEGDGETIGVQMPSPEKLTDILDEVAKYRALHQPGESP